MTEPVNGYEAEIAMLRAQHRADKEFQAERDRRYAEVKAEQEKALKIKETADLAALSLAREIQTYKDEKANELREQINSERNLYATKLDLAAGIATVEALIKPLAEVTQSQQGHNAGTTTVIGYVIGAAGVLTAIVAVIVSQL